MAQSPETRRRASASFEAARVPKALGATGDREGLRRAYLDLLKLSLCDLVGTTTVSAGRTADDRVETRVLADADRRWRSAGMDWPAHGLTMVGLARLDDLQACVERVVADGVPGDMIEAGSWRGGASVLIRATLDSLGAHERKLFVADSFQGLPPPPEGDSGDVGDLSAIEFLSVPVEEVRATFARLGYEGGVELVPGFFSETMPTLPRRTWSLARFDADSYDATTLVLETIYPTVAEGGYVIIDDYGAFDECARAVDDFRGRHGISDPLDDVDWTCVRWRRSHVPATS